MTLLPIILPKNYIAKVSAGDKIEAGKVIAYQKEFKEEVIHLFKDYGINLSKNPNALKRGLGDRVDEKTILATKKKLFNPKKIFSPVQGTIVKIDKDRGDVYVKTNLEGEGQTLLSPVEGVVDFCDNEKIVIKTEKDAISVVTASGEKTEGILKVLAQVEPESLSEEQKNKVLLVPNTTRLFVFKAIGIGINGLISNEIDEEIFEELLEKKIKAAVCLVGNPEFEKLKKQGGKLVLINPEGKSILIE